MSGLLNADAVGTTFASQIAPGLDRLIPIMVAASVFGTALISCFTASRIPFVAARDGQFPSGWFSNRYLLLANTVSNPLFDWLKSINLKTLLSPIYDS